MSRGGALDDDYVVSLLLKDAERNKKWNGTAGNREYVSSGSKRRSNAPKPNTTFLRNVIRETNSHNAALKEKEEVGSRAQMRDLSHTTARSGQRKYKNEGHNEGHSKRRDNNTRGEEWSGRWSAALGGLARSSSAREATRGDRDDRRVSEGKLSSRHRHDRGMKERSGSRVPDVHRSRQVRHDLKTRSRSRSPDLLSPHRKRQRTPPVRSRSRLSGQDVDHEPTTSKVADPATCDASDSDPLDEFIGPRPPTKVRARGRGALKPSSGMDSHFQPNYDPKTDVALESDLERDDWDLALEAVRDRAKWRQQGGDRLRAAGFTAEEVQKWENGDEKDASNVKWRAKGEGREWDRGKVMDADGLRLKPDW